MKQFSLYTLGLVLSTQPLYSQCYQNGIPCPTVPTSASNGTSSGTSTMTVSGSNGTDTIPIVVDPNGRLITQIYSLPALPSGTNTIGSISNTTFGVSQTGSWSVNLNGSLPGFLSPPTFNLGTLNGAATETGLQGIKTSLGNPFQQNGVIGNTKFGSTQDGVWHVGLDAGTNVIGSISNSGFTINGSLPTGTNTIGSVNVNGTLPVSGTFYQAIQPVSQSGSWTTGLTGTLPAFAATPTFNIGSSPIILTNPQGVIVGSTPSYTVGNNRQLTMTTAGALRTDSSGVTQPVSQSGTWTTSLGGTLPDFTNTPTVNLGTVGGVALDSSVQAVKTTLGSPFQAGGSIGNTSFGATQNGTWNIGTLSSITNPVGVTGTFWQATQPVSVVALPLPAGAATAAKQPSLGTAGTPSSDVISVQGVSGGVSLPVSVTSLPLPSGAATSALQTTMNNNLNTLVSNTTGGATAALQTSGNASLTSLVTNTTGLATASNQTSQITALNTLAGTVSSTASPAVTALTTQSLTITPVTTANSSSVVLKASPGTLYSLNIENSTLGGYVIAYDGAVPTNGGALTANLIRYHYSLPQNAPFDKSFSVPATFTSQISILCSSSFTTYTPITCALITGQIK